MRNSASVGAKKAGMLQGRVGTYIQNSGLPKAFPIIPSLDKVLNLNAEAEAAACIAFANK